MRTNENKEYTVVLKDGSIHKFEASSYEYRHHLGDREVDDYLFWAFDEYTNQSTYKATYMASDVRHIYESDVVMSVSQL